MDVLRTRTRKLKMMNVGAMVRVARRVVARREMSVMVGGENT